MLDDTIGIIAPHHCCGCGKTGTLLCSGCKYNIISEASFVCLACHRPTAKMWLCDECKVPYEKAWAVGERHEILKELIDKYKFKRARAAYRPLGDLLLSAVPDLPSNTVIVPIPTISAHIRERGYDHAALIAKYFAKKRELSYQPILQRAESTQQKQAGAKLRQNQAKHAFSVSKKLDDRPYLVVDDIITTGATLKYAAKALRQAGAKHVWVAVIARQTLD